MSSSNPKRKSSFLESMTFTSVSRNCDCDECCNDAIINEPTMVQIPEVIRNAVQNHKRAMKTVALVKRSQVRNLICRHSLIHNFALWEWTIPPSADPMIEFGNTSIYRIIWIKRLPKFLVVKHVGCGIIGSKSEEEGRQQLDWTENDVIFTSCIDRKAVGYIVEPLTSENCVSTNDTPSHSDATYGPAVFYIAKIPIETAQITEEEQSCLGSDKNESEPLFEAIRCIFYRVTRGKSNAWSATTSETSVQISGDDQELFRKCVNALLKQ